MISRVDVDGVSIVYDAEGEGPPVVLLHGLPGAHTFWQLQGTGLSDEFTVIGTRPAAAPPPRPTSPSI